MVSERNIEDALTYLAQDPHPLAVARFNLTKAENEAKQIYADCFLASNQSTVDAKKASAETNERFVSAKLKEAECVLELERHKARTKAAEMLIEIYRTESANARNAEKIF
jgi:DNA topoisomerase VI subunit B